MTDLLIAELDNLLELVEAIIPANPDSPKHRKLEKSLEKELVKYFGSLDDAFPYHQVDRLYNKYVKESLASDSSGFLDPLLAAFNLRLKRNLNGHLADIYMSGSVEMVNWGKTKGGIPIAYEGPPFEQAVQWADKHGAALVSQMDDETKRRLARTVSDGIKNKRGIPGLKRDIRDTFDNMSRYRSEMIAKTETANALSDASLDRMHDMGIKGKEWIPTGGACEICLGNAAEKVIPVNQAFGSGHQGPSAHPNCRCAIAPAILKK